MSIVGWIQIILFCAILVALVTPLGWYMTRVFNGERTFLSPVLRPVEIGLYRLGGVDETREQHWLVNPAGQSAVAPDLALNTAVSFITNTNWQNYGGESTMSYLVQMLGLTHQNF